MIITKTPMRISFAGGGSDLKEFYRNYGGAVTSMAINKYVYITVNKRFDHTIRVSYSVTEIVDAVEKIKHPIVKACLNQVGIEGGIEITSIADIPKGTGLGSSSSFTVGLLNALYAYTGKHISAERLAQEACHIEINVLKEPIGKQDQYIAAYGGLQFIQFNKDESVFVNPIICTKKTKEDLCTHVMMFYTGVTREANEILTVQKENTLHDHEKQKELQKMVNLALQLKDSLHNNMVKDVGYILQKGWEHKKLLANSISNPQMDSYYTTALKAGAEGGKLLGAGGGGFLLFYCKPEKHNSVRKALKLRELSISLEPQGSKIIYVEE